MPSSPLPQLYIHDLSFLWIASLLILIAYALPCLSYLPLTTLSILPRVIDTIHPHYRGIFMHLHFVEPPFLTFPPCVHLSLCSLCHPYTIPPSCPPPPHSYSLCVSYMYSRFTQ